MDIFKGQNVIEFTDRFKTDLDCKEYLAQAKWKDGFACTRCGHGAAQQRKDFSRT
ncbi:MAG TPA: transposase, partial [Gillisia sp.]|nr:transposase [Gillisia sp.]